MNVPFPGWNSSWKRRPRPNPT